MGSTMRYACGFFNANRMLITGHSAQMRYVKS